MGLTPAVRLLAAAADDSEFGASDDDLRRIGPGHLLGARREVQVEAAHAVPPSAHRQREIDGRAERHRAERTLVLRVRLWRERIARLAPLHLVSGRAERRRPRDEGIAVE